MQIIAPSQSSSKPESPYSILLAVVTKWNKYTFHCNVMLAPTVHTCAWQACGILCYCSMSNLLSNPCLHLTETQNVIFDCAVRHISFLGTCNDLEATRKSIYKCKSSCPARSLFLVCVCFVNVILYKQTEYQAWVCDLKTLSFGTLLLLSKNFRWFRTQNEFLQHWHIVIGAASGFQNTRYNYNIIIHEWRWK